MHIKEIILDGFKTYQKRTVISDIDPQFNAITGLNGSGKSNVLDAICFLLGLTSYQRARVSNLNELIYKGGHAGITQAQVTIVFDNSNKAASPSGYENCPTITISRIIKDGQSKYYLNGHTEQQNKIKNMFKSVSLNIENPYFLVQQGNISKIVNFNPKEILEYLEQTAGTSYYNDIKDNSIKLIQKKQEKVDEITNLLKTEIEPQMRKIEDEVKNYKIWHQGENELKRMEKFLKAYEYFYGSKALEEKQHEIHTASERDKEIKMRHDKIIKKIQGVTKEIQDIQEDIKKNNHENTEARKTLDEKKNREKNLKKELDILEKEREELKNDNTKANKNISELSGEISRLEQKISIIRTRIEKDETTILDKKNFFEEAKLNLEGYLRGDTSANTSGLIDNQIKTIETQISSLNSEIKQNEAKYNYEQKEINNWREEIKNFEKNSNMVARQIDEINNDMNQIKSKMQQISSKIENSSVLQAKQKNLEDALNHAQRQLSDFEKNCSNSYQFFLKYTDPYHGFDRRAVKGKVLQLITVSDLKFCKALDALAGGRLFNVVVDDENIAKALLNHNSFNGYINIIPNRKIQVTNVINDDQMSSAYKLARECNGSVWHPLDLIQFNRDLQPSIEFVFGSAFICSSIDVARKIAFSHIKKKCITLDGDIVDPSGTLTGGYINPNNAVLAKYQAFRELELNVIDLEDQLQQIDVAYQEASNAKRYLDDLTSEYERKKYQADLLKNNSIQTNLKTLEDIKQKELKLAELEVNIKDLKDRKLQIENDVNQLKEEKKKSKSSGDQKQVFIERKNKLEEEYNISNKQLKLLKGDLTKLEVEIETKKKGFRKKKSFSCK